ncbi:MAG: hypothetical protein JWL97_3542 [Gemmatimonadales bacterium]|nr:hypothetical protein [Gemmatimonadales bacterium]
MGAVIVSKGREFLTFRLKGTPVAGSEPLNAGWGVSPPAGGPFVANQGDVAPFNEAPEARVAGTSSLVTTATPNDTYQVAATITATAGRSVVEVFLSEVATKPFSTTVAAGAGTVIGSSTNTTLNTAVNYTPANGTYIQVRTEVMQVTAGTGTSVLTVVRGANGSTAIATITAADIVTLGNPPGTGTFGTTAGSLFFHADHGVITLANGDSVAYTLKTQVTS